jgi:cysteine desulfurase
MTANNETGVVQPVRQAAEIVHAAGGLLHTDAVQGAGKAAFDIGAIGADVVTVSAHKIGGPKGIGALIRRNEAIRPEPMFRGSAQERGLRPGTENISGIAGFGAAAKAARGALAEHAAHAARLRDRLEAGLRRVSPGLVIFGAAVERLPNVTLFAVPGIKAETAVIALDLDGHAVSSGSACNSGKVTASHVLAAMNVALELARGAVRVSTGPNTTESEIEGFIEAWTKVSASLLKTKQGMAA